MFARKLGTLYLVNEAIISVLLFKLYSISTPPIGPIIKAIYKGSPKYSLNTAC